MMTPYANPRLESSAWNICAIKLKGTIYIAHYKTGEQRQEDQRFCVKAYKTLYFGWKAENYFTSHKPEENPDFTSCIDINSEYISVFRANLGPVLVPPYYVKRL